MSIIINSLSPMCPCGKEGIEEKLYRLDQEIAEYSFALFKSIKFDLKPKSTRDKLYILMKQRDLLALSIGRLCITKKINFIIGIRIPPEPCEL